MYDIFFDLNDLQDTADESTDEYWGIGEVMDLSSFDQVDVEKWDKFLAQNPDYMIVKRSVNSNGLNCKDCGEHYPYAEANQSDGSLICYSCRRF